MEKKQFKPSYQKIDYSIRPAKCIERKLFCEIIGKLAPLQKIEEYRYIGFGSLFFSDFILFHKTFGFSDMVSIEKNTLEEKRFRYNSPYNCVELKFGAAAEVLPTLKWDKPVILWLDYDGKISEEVFADIGHFCTNAKKHSIIIVTVNANVSQSKTYDSEKLAKDRLKELTQQVGVGRVPHNITGDNLDLEGKYKILKRIITNEIKQDISERKDPFDDKDNFIYKQMFYYTYQDGAKMLTTGGILLDELEEESFRQLQLDQSKYYKCEDDVYNIVAPNLTFKETRFLDKMLPIKDGDEIQDYEDEEKGDENDKFLANEKKVYPRLRISDLPKEDVDYYKEIYRFFPNFVETEIK